MFDELLDFFSSLRAKGFKIGVEQCVAVYNLLAALAEQQILKDHPEDLATWIAPIVCGSPEQQAEFYKEYKSWLARRPQEIEREEPAPLGAERPVAGRHRSSQLKRWLGSTRIRLLAALSLLIVLAVSALLVRAYFSQPDSIPPVVLNDYRNVPIDSGKVRVSLEAQQPSPLTEQERLERLSPWKRFFYRYYSLVRTIAAGLPLLVLAGYWLRKFYRRLQLEKQSAVKTPDLDRLPIASASESLFRGAFFRSMSQGMRHQRETEVYELDIAATVESTARMAGALNPIERPLKSTSEYLVLIDRTTFFDQQAHFYDELINRLARNNIYIDCYYFKGDPRNCRKDDPRKRVTGGFRASYLALRDLRALHPGHTVLIFSDGAGLMDGRTGEPYQWVDMFSDWANRIILTPELEPDWGYRELALSASGFVVLPTTRNGLGALVRVIQTESAPRFGDLGVLPLFPELLHDAPQDWVDEDEPPPDVIEELRLGLMQFLDVEDYYWLSACAVYPQLEWDMTVSLGYKLTGREGFEERLIQLVRLPWFRHGKMPDWLRSSLIANLPVGKEEEIRKALDELLTEGGSKRGGTSLSVARPHEDPEAKKLRTVCHNLVNKIRRLRHPEAALPMESTLQDHVFLSFMSGRKPSRLAVALPDVLRPLFVKGREPWLRLSLRKLLAEAALAFALIFFLFPKRPELPLPPQLTVPDVEVTASPASGLPGGTYTIKVVSADPQKFSLMGTSLAVSPSVRDALTSTPAPNGEPSASELDAVIVVAGNFLGAEIPFEIIRDNKTLGGFNFTVNQVSDLTDKPAFTVAPFSAPHGSNFLLKITSPDCARYSLKDATLEAPAGSGIQIAELLTEACTLTAHVIIPVSASVGSIAFSLKRGDLNTSIPFTITSFECPAVTINASQKGDDYYLTAVVTGGQALSQPKFTWKVTSINEQGGDTQIDKPPFEGQGSASIVVRGSNLHFFIGLNAEVTVTGYAASCKVSAKIGPVMDLAPSPSPVPSSSAPPPPPPSPSPSASTSPVASPTVSPQCPKVSIKVSKGDGDYQFTSVVEGGKLLGRPIFNWNAIWRDQQGSSIIDTPIPFRQYGNLSVSPDSSITISGKDLESVDVLIIELTVTGYNPSCNTKARIVETPP